MHQESGSYAFNFFPLRYDQGIGNGIPLGAVVTTPEIAEVLTRRSYFNTFGGNPVCTAAGHAVLKVIQKDKLQNNAHVVGSYLKERLAALKDKYGSMFSLAPLIFSCIQHSLVHCKFASILLYGCLLCLVSAVIGDVRGRGFLLGVEFVSDRQLKTPAKAEALYIMDKMKGICVLFFSLC